MAVEFGLNVLVATLTSVSYIGMTLLIRFGWVSGQYLHAFGTDEELYTFVLYVAVSIAVELLNAAAINLLFFRPRAVSMLWVRHLFNRSKIFCLFFSSICTTTMINVFVPLSKHNFILVDGTTCAEM
jgi:hypothetical protein